MAGENAERITQIWSRVRDERALVADLEHKITDCELRRVLLLPAMHHLDDVEHFFLAEDNLEEPRTLEALSAWLDRAQTALDAASRRRKHAETTIEKFGADATLMTFAQRRAAG